MLNALVQEENWAWDQGPEYHQVNGNGWAERETLQNTGGGEEPVGDALGLRR